MRKQRVAYPNPAGLLLLLRAAFFFLRSRSPVETVSGDLKVPFWRMVPIPKLTERGVEPDVFFI